MAIISVLPVTLANGTTADATQVMSDLNHIVNQVNANAADATLVALLAANNNFSVVQTGVAATAAAHFPIASQVQNRVFATLTSSLGTNTLTARIAALALTAYASGQVFSFVPSQTNTGPASITIDSAGSSIIYANNATLVGGELVANVPTLLQRNGTQLHIIGAFPRLPTVQVVSSTGTHSVPVLARRAKVYAKGAGGSGGGSSGAAPNGGGGGEGEERWGWFNVVPGTTVTVTINAGGVAIGANTNAAGNTGGTTIVTDGTFTVTSNGGAGGASGNNGGAGGAGGAGGSGGNYGMDGAAGQAGADAAAAIGFNNFGGGKGGGSFGAAGNTNSGGGGGGGSDGAASGAGATGIAVIEYWP